MDGDRYVISRLINSSNLAFFISGEKNVSLEVAIRDFKEKNFNNFNNFLQVNKLAFEKIKFLIYRNSNKKIRIVNKIEKRFYKYLYITERLLKKTPEETDYKVLLKTAKTNAFNDLYPHVSLIKNKLEDVENLLVDSRETVSKPETYTPRESEDFVSKDIAKLIANNKNDPSALQYIKQSLQLGGEQPSQLLDSLLVGYFKGLHISINYDVSTNILSANIEGDNNKSCKFLNKKRKPVFAESTHFKEPPLIFKDSVNVEFIHSTTNLKQILFPIKEPVTQSIIQKIKDSYVARSVGAVLASPILIPAMGVNEFRKYDTALKEALKNAVLKPSFDNINSILYEVFEEHSIKVNPPLSAFELLE
jgi:hypothetical protein